MRSERCASRPSSRVLMSSYSSAAKGLGAPNSWKRRRRAPSFAAPGGSTIGDLAQRAVAFRAASRGLRPKRHLSRRPTGRSGASTPPSRSTVRSALERSRVRPRGRSRRAAIERPDHRGQPARPAPARVSRRGPAEIPVPPLLPFGLAPGTPEADRGNALRQLRTRQPRAPSRSGGTQLVELGPERGLANSGSRQLLAQALPFGLDQLLSLCQVGPLTLQAGYPFLIQACGGRGPSTANFRIAADCFERGLFRRQLVATSAQGRRPEFPLPQRACSLVVRAGGRGDSVLRLCALRDRRGCCRGLPNRFRKPVAIRFQTRGLRRPPGGLASDRLQSPGGLPLRLFSLATSGPGSSLSLTSAVSNASACRRGGLVRSSGFRRGDARFHLKTRNFLGQTLDLGPPLEQRLVSAHARRPQTK